MLDLPNGKKNKYGGRNNHTQAIRKKAADPENRSCMQAVATFVARKKKAKSSKPVTPNRLRKGKKHRNDRAQRETVKKPTREVGASRNHSKQGREKYHR